MTDLKKKCANYRCRKGIGKASIALAKEGVNVILSRTQSDLDEVATAIT
jgi:short-subunit dehydrogenase